MNEIRAITLDLDNTLWDLMPTLERAEANSYALLRQIYPNVTERYSVRQIQDLRQDIFESMPQIRHDLTEVRRQVFTRMLTACDYGLDGVDALMQRFLHDRNQLTLYPDSLSALKILHGRYPLVSLSDGNSDLEKVGIRDYFVGCVYAADVGVMKPHQAGFLKACEIAKTQPRETLHIGDSPDSDIDGARNAGLQTMWMRRYSETWVKDYQPDFTVTSMAEAVDILC
ncbi:MAG: HAD family hydrolase [Acidiferrobacterales bacterium]|nr:HAD family hydrolase [Acidiferrobacterales bacterium]